MPKDCPNDGDSYWNHTRYDYGLEAYYTALLLHSTDDGNGLRAYHHSYPEFRNHYYYDDDGDSLTPYHHNYREIGSYNYFASTFLR